MADASNDAMSSATMAQFMVLQRRYVVGLASRWEAIAAAGDDRTLQAALHRLAGSAASFGFERLGRCAKDAESLVAQGDPAATTRALEELQTEIGRIG